MDINFDLTGLVMAILEKYGVSGFAMLLCIYYTVVIQKKLDKLVVLNNKLFGIMLAMSSNITKKKFKGEN